MDRAGRIVVPKPVRDQLGLTPDAAFDLVVEGTGIRLDPVGPPPREVQEVDGWPVLAPVADFVLTDDLMRNLRDSAQR
jgi:AbrB family looped-hinge helix DNA binding protein